MIQIFSSPALLLPPSKIFSCRSISSNTTLLPPRHTHTPKPPLTQTHTTLETIGRSPPSSAPPSSTSAHVPGSSRSQWPKGGLSRPFRPTTADRARGGRRGHLAGIGRKGRDKPLFGHWLLELPGTQAEVEDGGASDGGGLPMVSRGVCVYVSGGCVCRNTAAGGNFSWGVEKREGN